MKSSQGKTLARANARTLANVSAQAAAYLREKDGETGAFEKTVAETVGNSRRPKTAEVQKKP